MRLLVAGGTVVAGGRRRRADVLVEDGLIAAVGEGLDAAGADELDASGCLVLPGGVDVHAHVFGAVETDTVSALCGGTTTVVSFLDEPAFEGETPVQATRRVIADELPRSACDLGAHAVIWEPGRYRAGDLAAAAELGVTSVKLWLAYLDLGIMIDDARAYEVSREAADAGVLVQAHCENGPLVEELRAAWVAAGRTGLREHARARPVELEREAVHRFLTIAGLAGADAYVVHVTGREPLDEIHRARARGQTAFAEVCGHHLAFDAAVYDEAPDPLPFMMTPPLRTAADHEHLWTSLADGALEVLSSDHGQPTLAAKVAAGDDFTKVPYGLPGLETRLAIGFTLGVEPGRLDAERLVEAASEAPARIFGLHPRKGSLERGADADVVVWDSSDRWTASTATLHDGLDYTPYEGMELTGRPRFVVAGGELLVEEGRFLGRTRPAEFQRRPPRARAGGPPKAAS
jgi:dihydropyrimidinase